MYNHINVVVGYIYDQVGAGYVQQNKWEVEDGGLVEGGEDIKTTSNLPQPTSRETRPEGWTTQ